MKDGLNSQEMELVGTLFQEAVDFLFQSATEKAKTNVLPFMMKRVIGDIMPTQMSPSGVKELQKEVFNNVEVRDFILELSFVFLSRWAASDNQVMALAANLSRGLSQTPYVTGDLGVDAVPGEIQQRLARRDEVYNMLASNSWLMMVVMMPLFMSSKSFKDPAPQRPLVTGTGGPTPVE